jgi:hypothetical protein
MKTIRKSVYRARLENELAKYQRRIQKMAENAYKIRQMIEQMTAEENKNAVHNDQREREVGERGTDIESGQPDVLDTTTPEAVLGEQPEELSSYLGDPGVDSGSAV